MLHSPDGNQHSLTFFIAYWRDLRCESEKGGGGAAVGDIHQVQHGVEESERDEFKFPA